MRSPALWRWKGVYIAFFTATGSSPLARSECAVTMRATIVPAMASGIRRSQPRKPTQRARRTIANGAMM